MAFLISEWHIYVRDQSMTLCDELYLRIQTEEAAYRDINGSCHLLALMIRLFYERLSIYSHLMDIGSHFGQLLYSQFLPTHPTSPVKSNQFLLFMQT